MIELRDEEMKTLHILPICERHISSYYINACDILRLLSEIKTRISLCDCTVPRSSQLKISLSVRQILF